MQEFLMEDSPPVAANVDVGLRVLLPNGTAVQLNVKRAADTASVFELLCDELRKWPTLSAGRFRTERRSPETCRALRDAGLVVRTETSGARVPTQHLHPELFLCRILMHTAQALVLRRGHREATLRAGRRVQEAVLLSSRQRCEQRRDRRQKGEVLPAEGHANRGEERRGEFAISPRAFSIWTR